MHNATAITLTLMLNVRIIGASLSSDKFRAQPSRRPDEAVRQAVCIGEIPDDSPRAIDADREGVRLGIRIVDVLKRSIRIPQEAMLNCAGGGPVITGSDTVRVDGERRCFGAVRD